METQSRLFSRPKNPNFSSGPCAKRPGWTEQVLKGAITGRSHRSGPAKCRLRLVLKKSRDILNVPDNYLMGIVPASDTGAVEMALWSLLGCRGADLLVWDSFGASWAHDVVSELKLTDTRILSADYGELPNLSQVNFDKDVVFAWNGTTSGVCVPNGKWILDDRKGLTICEKHRKPEDLKNTMK